MYIYIYIYTHYTYIMCTYTYIYIPLSDRRRRGKPVPYATFRRYMVEATRTPDRLPAGLRSLLVISKLEISRSASRTLES